MAGIVAALYVVASATDFPMTAAVVVMIVVGFCWIVARDVRRPSWSTDGQRSQDAAYAAAAIAVIHTPGQSSADCPSGFDGFSGGADCGGFGA
jgi:hypothetical protein